MVRKVLIYRESWGHKAVLARAYLPGDTYSINRKTWEKA